MVSHSDRTASCPIPTRTCGATPLGVVAVNRVLAPAKRVASIAHGGLGCAIDPIHTAADGDTHRVSKASQRDRHEGV